MPDPSRRRPSARPQTHRAPLAAGRRGGPRGPHRRGHGRAAAAARGAAAAAGLRATPSATAGQRRRGALQQAFTDAAQQYQVPQSVLLGVSYLESRWDSHQGAPSVTGGYGPMHLTDARTALASRTPGQRRRVGGRPRRRRPAARRAAARAPGAPDARRAAGAGCAPLDRAAELTGLSAEQLREPTAANVRGGAALLAADAAGAGPCR